MNWISKNWLLALLSAYFGLFFLVPINFTASDLGRHLVNGRVFVESGQLIETNFYSFTHPDFPAINHHWLFGVMVFWAEKLVGFGGLTVLNALVVAACVGIVGKATKNLLVADGKKTSTGKDNYLAILVAMILAVPLITSRVEIRPETISLLMVSLFYYLLSKSLTWKIIFTLIILQVIWTNTHLFFVFGPVIAGYFWLRLIARSVAGGKTKQIWSPQLTTLVLISIATLINSHGLLGVIQPFNIFQEYGYQVAENQSVWFMINRLGRPIYYYSLLVVLVGILLALTAFFSRLKKYWPELLLIIFFGVMGLSVSRVMSFYGLVSIPILALAFFKLENRLRRLINSARQSSLVQMFSSLLGFALLILFIKSNLFMPSFSRYSDGLYPNANNSAAFFKENKLTGPIFNNYDIGGYLIYHLYPAEKVFVDNRPEAYPLDFFQKEYIPGQETQTGWQLLDEKYQFNVIYFYRHDMTPWAQPFLVERVKDDAWAVVYFDDFAVIMVKKNQQHEAVIKNFEIPSEMFGV